MNTSISRAVVAGRFVVVVVGGGVVVVVVVVVVVFSSFANYARASNFKMHGMLLLNSLGILMAAARLILFFYCENLKTLNKRDAQAATIEKEPC